MHQNDMERFAFLYLCGQRDRDLLAGRENMSFQDFNRLVYITDFLGLNLLSLEIWNQFSLQFKERLDALEGLLEENLWDTDAEEYENDVWPQDEWIEEFCASASNDETEIFLRNIFSFHSRKEAISFHQPEK